MTKDLRVPECPYCMAGDGPCVGHGGMKKVAPVTSKTVTPGFTSAEMEVLDLLGRAFNAFHALPKLHGADLGEFVLYTHALQNMIMQRPGARILYRISDADAAIRSDETSSDVSALLTVQQHNKRLRAALSAIAVGTPDLLPPFRIMGEAQLRAMARKALGEVPPVEPADKLLCGSFHISPEERDALRYRFLRQPGNAIVYAKDRNAWGKNASGHVKYDTPDQLDSAVDAAMGQSSPEKASGSGDST